MKSPINSHILIFHYLDRILFQICNIFSRKQSPCGKFTTPSISQHLENPIKTHFPASNSLFSLRFSHRPKRLRQTKFKIDTKNHLKRSIFLLEITNSLLAISAIVSVAARIGEQLLRSALRLLHLLRARSDRNPRRPFGEGL